ncbi:MAG TPA: phage tail protein [Dongiaceae bacterium]|nr:phage tail protein [Dongiaceae bacterium]
MARTAIVTGAGLLGAAIGSEFGSPGLGFALGSAAGSVVASFAVPSGSPTKGPRLTDLKVTSSAYGAFIPIGYGTVIVGGNIIWSTDLKEHKKKSKSGKGSSDTASTVINFYYTASFALGLAYGPAEDVLRIWFDDKLYFDKTGTGPVIRKGGLSFRFYPGDDSQLPDPSIVAALGEENTPAWRGLAYIVFDELDLSPFANRIPSIKVELTYNAIPTFPYTPLTIPSGAPAPVGNFLAVDINRNVAYTMSSGGGYLERINLDTMMLDFWKDSNVVNFIGNGFAKATLGIGLDGYVYGSDGTASNDTPLLKVNPETLTEIFEARYGEDAAFDGYPANVTGTAHDIASVQNFGVNAVNTYAIVISQFAATGYVGVFTVNGGPSTAEDITAGSLPISLAGWSQGTPGEGPASYMVGATDLSSVGAIDTVESWAYAYGMLDNGKIVRVIIAGYPLFQDTEGGGTEALAKGCAIDYFDPLELDDLSVAIGKSAGYYFAYNNIGTGWWDQTDDTIIFTCRLNKSVGGSDVLLVKYRPDKQNLLDPINTVVWAMIVPSDLFTGSTHGTKLIGNRLAYMLGSTVYQFDTNTGAMTTQVWPIAATDGSFPQVYDTDSDSLLVFITGHNWTRIYLNRGTGDGTTDGTIVADLCSRVGYGPGDIDVSQLTDPVYGFLVSNQSAIKDNILALGQAFFFDAVESDYKIKFVKRGGSSVVTIPQDDMMWLGNNGSDKNPQFMSDDDTQDVDLPFAVSVAFLNKDQQDQQGSMEYRRIDAPDATMGSQNRTTAQLPIVMTGTDALKIAEQALDAAWGSRRRYGHMLPPKYLKYDGTDVVTFSYSDATSTLARIIQLGTGADFSLDVTSASEDPTVYGGTLVADNANYPAQVIAGPAVGKLFVLNIPLPRDVDDTGGVGSRVYLATSGYGAATNPGRVIMRSYDQGVTWDEVTRTYLDATWGSCITALPDTTHPFAWNDDYSLTIQLTDPGNEALASVTDDQVYAGSNVAAIIKSNGEAEIIQFGTVTVNTDGSYTLSHFLRGRRGTEVNTAGHAIGDYFLLLDANEMTSVVVPLNDIGRSVMWKVVTAGQVAADVDGFTRITTGADLKPYAVDHIAVAASGSDLNLTWVRRTRLGGGLFDGTGTVPLSETSEAYEIDILSGPGGIVKRTLSGLTSPAATYTGAQILADFGTSISSLTLKIYQLSGIVGRGFAKETTLAVTGLPSLSPTAVPAIPTGLASASSAGQNALSWNANVLGDYVTAYHLYRAAGTGAAFADASLIWSGSSNSYVDGGLSVGQKNTYFLTATNAIGTSLNTAGLDTTAGVIVKDLRIVGGTPGVKPTGLQELLLMVMLSGDALPKDLIHNGVNSKISCEVAPTANYTITLKKNGSTIGTGTILAGHTTGTWTFTSAVTFADGDLFTITAPASDATMSGLALTILGSRTT